MPTLDRRQVPAAFGAGWLPARVAVAGAPREDIARRLA